MAVTIPSGWGTDVLKGQHYAAVYCTVVHMVDWAARCAIAGLLHNELVYYSIRPDQLVGFMELLETKLPTLLDRVSNGQLMQRTAAQAVNAWMHGGPDALKDILVSFEQEAKQRSFAGARLIVDASMVVTESPSRLEWYRMRRSVVRHLQRDPDSSPTTFCLYKRGEGDERLLPPHVVLIDIQEPT